MSNFPVQDFIFKHFPWTSIFYARKHYGFEWLWLIRAWRDAEAGTDSVLGGEKDKAEDFFYRCAHRSNEEVIEYQCVNGCCVVLWHPKRGNTGGYGPAGCSCDDLDDPRDLERGPLNAKA